jgi:hypothetical protein
MRLEITTGWYQNYKITHYVVSLTNNRIVSIPSGYIKDAGGGEHVQSMAITVLEGYKKYRSKRKEIAQGTVQAPSFSATDDGYSELPCLDRECQTTQFIRYPIT